MSHEGEHHRKSKGNPLKSAWESTATARQWINNGFTIIGYIAVLLAFLPFGSWLLGNPDIAVRVREGNNGKKVIRGKSGEFGVAVGTLNQKHEVLLQEVRIIYNPTELTIKDNDNLPDAGLDADRNWVEWRGEKILDPKNFILFNTTFTATAALTNTTTIQVVVKATVPSSDLAFPWKIVQPPTQKITFPIVLNWEPDESAGAAGYLIAPLESLLSEGSSATNAMYVWTHNGSAPGVRVLEKLRPKTDSDK